VPAAIATCAGALVLFSRVVMARTTMRRPYQITGVLIVALAVFIGKDALDLTYYSRLGPGPGFFSFWLALILGVLGIVMVVQATLQASEPMPEDFYPEGAAGYLRIGAIAVALLASALLLEPLGFVLTMVGMYLFVLLTLGVRNIPVIALVTLAGSFGA
jgi:putative tricarboxylic transport membrane protein